MSDNPYDISAVISAVEKCGDKKAKAQLQAMLALLQRLNVILNAIEPPYHLENEASALLTALSVIGMQLIRFLSG